MAPAKLQPALLGGIAMGVLSVLPFISLANCCCAWILFGGGLAAYLMQQDHPAPITVGDGALVGLLAGLIGAVLWAGLSIPVGMMMGPFQAAFLDRMLETARDVPPEVRAMIESMRGGTGSVGFGIAAGILGLLFVGLPIGGIFGAIGGILGALMFRSKVPPPPPPPPPGFGPPTFTPPTFTPPPPVPPQEGP
jgi:hypothetical protein